MFAKWKLKLKEKLNRAKEDDRGSAFVFVILGVMFVSVVGATLLSVATNYVLTTIVDQRSTESFYSAEGVIAEVRSGLEELAGKSNEYSYMQIIEKYSKTTNMKKQYGLQYLVGIVNLLQGNPVDSNLNSWDGSSDLEGAIDLDTLKKYTTRPDCLSSNTGFPTLVFQLKADRSDPSSVRWYLVIKGLKVTYKDSLGFETLITTDIVMDIPDYNFEGDSTYEQLKNYIVICDDKLAIGNTLAGTNDDPDTLSPNGANFKGNIYAGGEKENNNYKTGIEIEPKTATTFNSNTIISRGDMTAYTGSDVKFLNKNGEVWLKNIALKPFFSSNSTLGTKFDISAKAYILDDLSIEDNNAQVSLGGQYYGYSYSRANERDVDVKAEYSSAILVNGKNTYLNADQGLAKLNKLILAGRTFVSKEESESAYTQSENIMMGESAAVKSNQLAYLLPNKYIKAGHNPLTNEELGNPDYLKNINGMINVLNIESLKNDASIWDYVDHNKPVVSNFHRTGSSTGFVYLYLNFTSPEKANEYFAQYYEADSEFENVKNKELLDERALTYISSIVDDNDGMKFSPSLYLIAGNIVENYYSTTGTSQLQAANYFASGKVSDQLLEDGIKKMKRYLGKQLTLLNNGYTKVSTTTNYRYELLPDSDCKELVKDVVINYGKISDVDLFDFENQGLDPNYKVYVTPTDCSVSGSINNGIIISGGNVTVDADFNGLILAKGKTYVTGTNVNATADIAMVGELLDEIKNHSKYSKYFRGLSDKSDKAVDVSDCIGYENWSRNAE